MKFDSDNRSSNGSSNGSSTPLAKTFAEIQANSRTLPNIIRPRRNSPTKFSPTGSKSEPRVLIPKINPPDFSLLSGLKRNSTDSSIIYVRAEKMAKFDSSGQIEFQIEKQNKKSGDGGGNESELFSSPESLKNGGRSKEISAIDRRFDRARTTSKDGNFATRNHSLDRNSGTRNNSVDRNIGTRNNSLDRNFVTRNNSVDRNSTGKMSQNESKRGPKPIYDWKKFIDEEDLRCLKCRQQLCSMHLLEKHVKTHLDRRLYRCAKCSYSHFAISSVRQHLAERRCKEIPKDELDRIQNRLNDFILEEFDVDDDSNRRGSSRLAAKQKKQLLFPSEKKISTSKTKKKEISVKLDETRCHCGLDFANSIALDNHIRGVHGLIVIYSCLKCRYESYSRGQTRFQCQFLIQF